MHLNSLDIIQVVAIVFGIIVLLVVIMVAFKELSKLLK